MRRRADGALVGISRYLGVRRADRVVEIGWTWFNPSVWRTGVNVETKLLMFTRAFETLGCVRVELKTDARNERSRGAMAALPAQFEGIMRKHKIIPDVGQRDSAYYSVIDDEWPTVPAAPRSPPVSTPSPSPFLAVVAVFGVDHPFGRGAHFFARLPGRGDRLFGRVGHALARLAADDVAEGFLEAVGPPAGVEARLRPSPASSGACRRSGGAPRASSACRSGRSP